MNWKNRHDYAAYLGRRVSRGEWERTAHAFCAHPALDSLRRPKLVVVGYSMNDKGERVPIVGHRYTLALLPDTPRHSRKVPMSERFMPKGKRDRYAPRTEHAGIISHQRWQDPPIPPEL